MFRVQDLVYMGVGCRVYTLRVEESWDKTDPSFFFINHKPLKRWSTTNYAPFALDSEPESLTDIKTDPNWLVVSK